MRWFIARWPRFSQSANVEKTPLLFKSLLLESENWRHSFLLQSRSLSFISSGHFNDYFREEKKVVKWLQKNQLLWLIVTPLETNGQKQWMIFWIIWYFFGSSLKCQIAKLYCFSNYFQSFFGLYPISERISILGSVLNWLSSWCSRKEKSISDKLKQHFSRERHHCQHEMHFGIVLQWQKNVSQRLLKIVWD